MGISSSVFRLGQCPRKSNISFVWEALLSFLWHPSCFCYWKCYVLLFFFFFFWSINEISLWFTFGGTWMEEISYENSPFLLSHCFCSGMDVAAWPVVRITLLSSSLPLAWLWALSLGLCIAIQLYLPQHCHEDRTRGGLVVAAVLPCPDGCSSWSCRSERN